MNASVAASVRQRLLNLSKSRGESFQRTLDRFVLERFLYRLSVSPHGDEFALKGAALYHLWSEAPPRPTRDLDLLAWGDPAIPLLEETFRGICRVACLEDGLIFDPDSVKGSRIREDKPYQGVRILLKGLLGTARVSLQIDIGFGDSVVPPLVEATFPSLLGHPEPRIRAYRWETAIAEKLHGIAMLGLDNSRAKDYFDLWHLAQAHVFESGILAQAIQGTFARRGMAWPPELPEGLSDRFGADPAKQAQWRGFLGKSGISDAPSLPEAIRGIRSFLGPILAAGPERSRALGQWSAGQWQREIR